VSTQEFKLTWGGPTVVNAVGVKRPACMLCDRQVLHDWPEHAAQVDAVTDRLGQAAGLPQGDAA